MAGGDQGGRAGGQPIFIVGCPRSGTTLLREIQMTRPSPLLRQPRLDVRACRSPVAAARRPRPRRPVHLLPVAAIPGRPQARACTAPSWPAFPFSPEREPRPLHRGYRGRPSRPLGWKRPSRRGRAAPALPPRCRPRAPFGECGVSSSSAGRAVSAVGAVPVPAALPGAVGRTMLGASRSTSTTMGMGWVSAKLASSARCASVRLGPASVSVADTTSSMPGTAGSAPASQSRPSLLPGRGPGSPAMVSRSRHRWRVGMARDKNTGPNLPCARTGVLRPNNHMRLSVVHLPSRLAVAGGDLDGELAVDGAEQPLDLAPGLRAARGGVDQLDAQLGARPHQP